ncbi:MAG TPA: lysophospholipid acyltransferase family protein [Xanthobacteraceae bacterium]|nr:lysophospholipid acyltransferase family protein [Xanthobacteraceae bacterium]
MLSLKRLLRSRWTQQAIGMAAAEYLRLIWKTSRVVIEPPDIYERVVPDLPVIVAMWHGQHFLVPFLRRAEHRVKVLISRHHDGEINAIAAERLGVGTIRGSGDHGRRFDRKGGVGAFKAMLTALDEGYIMALTADVPKVARVAGDGIVKLAQVSGRAIYPVAVTTSRRIELDNWDRSAVNLPFGRMAIVVGEPIRVARDADKAALEACRRAVETGLNAVTQRAYDIVDLRERDRADVSGSHEIRPGGDMPGA